MQKKKRAYSTVNLYTQVECFLLSKVAFFSVNYLFRFCVGYLYYVVSEIKVKFPRGKRRKCCVCFPSNGGGIIRSLRGVKARGIAFSSHKRRKRRWKAAVLSWAGTKMLLPQLCRRSSRL